ncbi:MULTISPECIES: hypothetical protein [Butyricimonas]|uniref:hypothetical protein n=1 Tax=Butyricimonas TaxID=574697 RepID=UPI0007FB4D52|nr:MULTISPECIES: hypothetical protein [Butyricimonas]
MKVYRQSFWKTAFGLPAVIGFVYLILLVIPSGIAEGLSCLEMVKIVFIAYSFPFCMVLFLEFYVILLDDVLFVKNTIFPFREKKVYFKDIKRINIVDHGGNAIPYMQIITGKTKLVWRYYLDRVGRKDLSELVASLRENGIEVDVVGMDVYS